MTTCEDHTLPNGHIGYIAWHEWAEKQSESHDQVKCDECGRFEIWVARQGVDS